MLCQQEIRVDVSGCFFFENNTSNVIDILIEFNHFLALCSYNQSKIFYLNTEKYTFQSDNFENLFFDSGKSTAMINATTNPKQIEGMIY